MSMSNAHANTQGLVGPSGDPQARLRFLLQLGAEENARAATLKTITGMPLSAIQKKRRCLPKTIVGPPESEKLPMVGNGRSRLVIGVTLADNHILGHCGSLPYEMLVLDHHLAGLRYAFLLQLVVCSRFTDWLPSANGAKTEPHLNKWINTASRALELSLTPWAKLPAPTWAGGAQNGLGYDTFDEWRCGILHWFPTRPSDFEVVHRDVTLPSTAQAGCIFPELPEGVDAKDVEWHVVDVDLEALENWSQSIEAKAKELFASVMKMMETPGESMERVENLVSNAEW